MLGSDVLSRVTARTPRPTDVSTRVVGLLALAIFINYVDRGNLSTAAPLLKDELHLSYSQIGTLLAAFFWSYAPAQLLGGWLALRYDVRYVLAGGLALWAGATLCTGLAGGFATLLILRLLLGLGECVFYPCQAQMLAQGATEDRRGGANGLVVAGQVLGLAIGALCGGLLMAAAGWRSTFFVFGAGSLLWLWPWLQATRRAPEAEVPAPRPSPVTYLEILRRRAVWGTSAASFLAFFGFYFVLTWMPTYLVKHRGFSVAEMAWIGALPYCADAAGAYFFGWLSDRWIRAGACIDRVRRRVLAIGLAGASLAFVLGAVAAGNFAAVLALVLAGLFIGMATPQIFSLAQIYGGARAAGKWMAVQNMFGNIAGATAPMVVGLVVERTGSYFWAFALAALMALLGALLCGFLLPTVRAVEWPDEAARVAHAAPQAE